MYQATSEELIQELNRALGALRITYPTLSRSQAIQDSVVIEEFWEELFELDSDRAVAWLKTEDTVHLREDLYTGESLPFGYANLGQAFADSYSEDSEDYSHLTQPDRSGFGGWGSGNEFGIGGDDWAGDERE